METLEAAIRVFNDNPDDPQPIEQLKTCLNHERAVAGALMGDHHLGYSMPIGGVVAYDRAISPSGVGYDIACGNKAVRLDVDADRVSANIDSLMDEIFEKISFGVGRNNDEKVDHELFDSPLWDTVNKCNIKPGLKDMARNQLGTVGSGNHYIDVLIDLENNIWIGVHFGSRGLGHKIATHFIKAGGGSDGMFVEPVVFEEGTDLFEQYVQCMALAGQYAYAGRDWVCNKVAEILGGQIVESVHNHHNFAWKETHEIAGEEKEVWVVRKGATPAFPGQLGFVGGSMMDKSVIVCGTDTDDSKKCLRSTVHGAGRVMSRSKAAGKKRWNKQEKRFELKSKGVVDEGEMREAAINKGVSLRGAGADEAPQCYKDLGTVIASHGQAVLVTEELYPLGVAMAGGDVFDPFKD